MYHNYIYYHHCMALYNYHFYLDPVIEEL